MLSQTNITNTYVKLDELNLIVAGQLYIAGVSSLTTCMRMASRNLYKCKQVVYGIFCLRSYLQCCCCLFISVIRYFYTALGCFLFISLSSYFFFFFVLMLLLYFCLFVNLVFVFGAFAYHFKNTIFIFVTI